MGWRAGKKNARHKARVHATVTSKELGRWLRLCSCSCLAREMLGVPKGEAKGEKLRNDVLKRCRWRAKMDVTDESM